MDQLIVAAQVAAPRQLENLSPLVAVCVIFAGLLSVLMTAFLAHLAAKDKRQAELVQGVQAVLSQMQIELTRLAENDRRQTEILSQMLARCEACTARH